MLLFKKRKDGGKYSPVDAYFVCEIKGLLSIAFLKFNKGGREAFHTHAFDALTWFLSGDLVEEDVNEDTYKYRRSLIPKFTSKSKNHRVKAAKDSWCFTLRGAWDKTWTEYNKEEDVTTTFSHGRNIINKSRGVL